MLTKHAHQRTSFKRCLLIIGILFLISIIVFWYFSDHLPRYQYQFNLVVESTLSSRPESTTTAVTIQEWSIQDWVRQYNVTHLFDWTWHKNGDYKRCHIPPSYTSKFIPRKLTSTVVVHDTYAYFRSHPDEGCIVDSAPTLPNPIPHPIPRARSWPETCAALNISHSWILCFLPQSEVGKYLPTTTHFVATATFNAFVDKGHCSTDVPGTVFTEHATFHPQGWVNARCAVDPITRLPLIKPKNRHIELIDSLGVYLSAPGHFAPQQLPRLLRLLAVAPTTAKVLVAKGGIADLLVDVLVERGVVTRDRIIPFEKGRYADHFANIVYHSESWPYQWNQTHSNSLHDRTDMQLVHRVLTGYGDQPSTEKRNRVILIKRKPGHARALIQHEDVAAFMKSEISKSNLSSTLHFEVFTAQGHIGDHIALFRQARIIVAPHGAGLMNCLWASPRTYVVEIGYSTGMLLPQMYAEMSLHLDHNYWLCKGRGDYGSPIHVDMQDFAYIFNEILQEIKSNNQF
ncbi:unnamed protein product [Adineta ricciae]|uniref:Glycosyltransferase 61 catalytic domain-containing protein n=2 Tax=Adineta ricciae TaxID=249248 RepID=A0A814ICC7_ADIRI|nr:unnamed protein product [Adineta ricciae]